jgi:AcrR family transcriptional regulator
MAVRGESDRRAVLPPRERRRRGREQMMAAILDAAREVMRERGVAGLSLREVARRVAMQAPSLYEYFPSKAALYDALFALGVRLFQEICDRSAPDTTSFWDLLQALFEVNMRFAREYPELYQLVFEHPVPGFVPSDHSMAASQRLLDAFHQRVVSAIDAGQITPGVPASQARDLMIAMMQGITSQHVANDPGAAPGTGRYGGLIGPALALFLASWAPRDHAVETPPAAPGRRKEGSASASARLEASAETSALLNADTP